MNKNKEEQFLVLRLEREFLEATYQSLLPTARVQARIVVPPPRREFKTDLDEERPRRWIRRT